MSNPVKILVRPCFEHDLEQVALIYAHHVATGTGSFETAPPGIREMKERWARIAARGWPWLVACPQDDVSRIAGFAYGAQYRDRAAYAHAFEDSVYVAPGWERRGVGIACLGSLLGELQLLDCRQVIAVIGDSANAASIALHAKAGFSHVGTLWNIGWKFGRWLDVVLMQRELPQRMDNAS
jgi:L-amino acid N-acyltransferase YncA